MMTGSANDPTDKLGTYNKLATIMPNRVKGRAVFYGRRSSDQQEASLEMQVQWAMRTSANMGIPLAISPQQMADAMAARLSNVGDLYIDDSISGSVSDRSGWQACSQRLMSDKSVSHLFVNQRDRIARPDNPGAAVADEHLLSQAGITLVFNSSVISPSTDGSVDIGQAIKAMVDYHQGGQFLRDLSRRIIDCQRVLASQGFSTGGLAPYGFARFLKSPSGEVTRIPDGMRVKQTGCHVVHLPDDDKKIAVWISILQMREQGVGIKAIANYLNERGIPSPDAGRIRTDNGKPHRVSGLWSASTISSLCRNPIITGVLEHGVHSEGKHYRFTPDGSRPLELGERDGDKVVRVINPAENRIRVEATFDPCFPPGKFAAIQSQTARRAKSQAGIPRSKDPGRYPLATRVIDLTEGCGSVMYGVPHNKEKAGVTIQTLYYKCARYMKAGACHHNKVDAEKLLDVTLRALKHSIRQSGSRPELIRKLSELATNRGHVEPEQSSMRQVLEARLAALSEQRTEIGKKIATEADPDLAQIFRSEFTEKGKQLQSIQIELNTIAPSAVETPAASAETQVSKALELLDKLEKLATVPEARDRLYAVLNKLGVWVGLDFHEVQPGKRALRRIRYGVISIGGYYLPVPIHGRDCCDPKDSPSVDGCSINQLPAASIPVLTPGDGDGQNAGKPAKSDEKVDSSTKVNRGDRIRTCDLLVPNQSRYQPAPRPEVFL